MGKILILPDVHGRAFWEDACYNHKDEFDKIVFLGDYVSPYGYEGISDDAALEEFKKVLEFKKENKKKVVLLFGNHDGSYISTSICECRTDYRNYNELNRLFLDNIKLFDLAWETKVGNKRYFFSHSGVRKGWLENIAGLWFQWDKADCEKLPEADIFNNVFHAAYDTDENEIRQKVTLGLGIYSTYRGWGGAKDGSIVWADIREYSKPEYKDVMFICGHTQLEEEPIIAEHVADLDVRRPFVLDTETGKIEEYK